MLYDPTAFNNFSFRHRQPEVACAVAEEADNHQAVLVPLQGCTKDNHQAVLVPLQGCPLPDQLEETLAARTQFENSTKKLTN